MQSPFLAVIVINNVLLQTLLLALDCDLNVPLSAEVLIGLVRSRVDNIILLEKVIRGNHFEHELAERIEEHGREIKIW